MNRNRSFAIVFTFLFLLSFSFYCYADDSPKLDICQDSSSKEGLQNELGEWVIPPIYDMISYNDDIYWLFIETSADNTFMMGVIDTKRGLAIPTHYDEILIGDELIVAHDPSTHVYDIFDKEWKLIYTLSGEYDYVVPNRANYVDVVDIDGNIHTIQIPSYLVTVY